MTINRRDLALSALSQERPPVAAYAAFSHIRLRRGFGGHGEKGRQRPRQKIPGSCYARPG